ncbi:MAG: wax ester/triacylglycerol synthase domain-containing protein [Actinomycetota bacterium]
MANDPSDHMTSSEAMMWTLERDPWLAPSGGSITIYDRPLDLDRFRAGVRQAVAANVRLRQHVEPGVGGIVTPRWEPSLDFDLDDHIRRIDAPGDGGLAALIEWTRDCLTEPYRRDRPLWEYVVIDGLQDGKGALATKLHHTVGDGATAMAIAQAYTDTERDAPMPPPVDLARIIADDPVPPHGIVDDVRDVASGLVHLPWALAHRAADLIRHPEHVSELRTEVRDLASTVVEQLQPAGSPLWTHRSERRHFEILSLPFAETRAAAKQLGGSINDLFLAGITMAGRRYHDREGVPVERFHATFVVSTRTAGEEGGNAFSPVPVELPAGEMSVRDRMAAIHEATGRRRGEVHGEGPIGAVAGVMNLLPGELSAAAVKQQASHIDFATSNLPGMLGETYVAGARTEHCYGFGPVAGTAFNITAVSTSESFDIGVNIDPAAVTKPELLRSSLAEAYEELLLAGA